MSLKLTLGPFWPAELGIGFLQSAFSLRSVDILVTVGTWGPKKLLAKSDKGKLYEITSALPVRMCVPEKVSKRNKRKWENSAKEQEVNWEQLKTVHVLT